MRKIDQRHSIIMACFLAWWSGPAAADTVQLTPEKPPPAPSFITLDRNDGRSAIGASMGLSMGQSDAPPAMRMDFYGRVKFGRDLGLFTAIPVSVADVPGAASNIGIGNLEIGSYYLWDRGNVPFLIRSSMVFATADIAKSAVHARATPARFSDVVTSVPGVSSLRLSASMFYRHEQLFLRGDVGVDLPLWQEEVGDVPAVVRVNAGAGIDMGRFIATAELSNIMWLDNLDARDFFWPTFALGVQTRTASVEPYVAMVFPLNGGVRETVSFSAIVGVQMPLGRNKRR